MIRAAAAVLAVAVAGCASVPAEDPRVSLLAQHARIMEAHLKSDPSLLTACDAEDFISANRGRISYPTLAERRDRFERYLGATRFTEYRDVVPPVAKVSSDGTLGFVIAQVKAEGTRRTTEGATEQMAFESAWIELYERRDGAWRCIGNVSNFAP